MTPVSGQKEGKIMAGKTATPKKPAAKKPAAANKNTAEPAKAKFAKAIEEARAGVQVLGKEAQDRAGVYREKFAGASGEWMDEAKILGDQAKEKAVMFAEEGKAKASDAISGLGKIVAENAGTLDEKLGPKYGDYARTAARTMQETAAKIEAKNLGEIGSDAKEFVRKSPGLAIGLAAVAGFFLAGLFRRGGDD